jgi:hypothetical protein
MGGSILSTSDVNVLVSLFQEKGRAPKKGQGGGSGGKGGKGGKGGAGGKGEPEFKEVSVLDSKRVRNVEIVLKQFKHLRTARAEQGGGLRNALQVREMSGWGGGRERGGGWGGGWVEGVAPCSMHVAH